MRKREDIYFNKETLVYSPKSNLNLNLRASTSFDCHLKSRCQELTRLRNDRTLVPQQKWVSTLQKSQQAINHDYRKSASQWNRFKLCHDGNDWFLNQRRRRGQENTQWVLFLDCSDVKSRRRWNGQQSNGLLWTKSQQILPSARFINAASMFCDQIYRLKYKTTIIRILWLAWTCQ